MSAVFAFPGQGPQEPAMLDAARARPGFEARYTALVRAIGRDPLAELAARGPEILRENVIASAVTVLSSALERDRLGAHAPVGLAGYSVGQWTALWAAGVIAYEDALRVVAARARFMDECEAGAMLAVIGLGTDAVEALCAALRAEGRRVAISNYNCLGQLTLAGAREDVAEAERRLGALSPRKLAPVPVAGAWHSALLAPAAERFRRYLDDVPLAVSSLPVADNVTGDLLPADPTALRDRLAAHVCSPVRWDAGLRALLAATGADTVIEVGHGDMLTKFGFFIDRSRRHVSSMKVT